MSTTLVILLAETRAAEITFDSFKTNVLDTLNADLCVCIGIKPDYDYSNPFYQLAKYRFLYDEPEDFADAFDYASEFLSRDRPVHERIENVNGLFGKIAKPNETTDDITFCDTTVPDHHDYETLVIHGDSFSKHEWKNKVYCSHRSYPLVAEKQVVTYKKPVPWREFLKVKSQFLGGIKDENHPHEGSAGILIFFRWFLLHQLQQNDLISQYDQFVITRSDFMFLLPHPKLDSRYIWIPDGEHYGGFTDRHVVLPRPHVEAYLNILNHFVLRSNEYLLKMKQREDWNLERLIYFHLEQNEVLHHVKQFPYIMYSVRASNGSTRWAEGTWNAKLDYFVKYAKEYESATKFEKLFSQSDMTIDAFYNQHVSVSDYIANSSYCHLAKWTFCDRYGIHFAPQQIEKDDVVFLNLDLFDSFIQELRSLTPRHRFTLISFNSDKAFTTHHINALEPYVRRVFAQNNTVSHELVQSIPIGFRDWPFDTVATLKQVHRTYTNKTKCFLLYLNFAMDTNVAKRKECFETFRKENWVTYRKQVSLTLFYLDVMQSKYVLSPEGAGIDCHRIYEAMYYDTVPILKTSAMDDFYRKLPVVIVQTWDEITVDFLKTNYEEHFKKLVDWKSANPEWLSPLFWFS
jgi:hypothetical protein